MPSWSLPASLTGTSKKAASFFRIGVRSNAKAVELVNIRDLFAILEIRQRGVGDVVIRLFSSGLMLRLTLHLPKGQAQMLPFSSQSLSKFQAG